MNISNTASQNLLLSHLRYLPSPVCVVYRSIPFELVMLMDDSCCVLSDCSGHVDIKYSSESKLDIFLRWYSLADFLKLE